MLNGYNSSYNASAKMTNAVNAVLFAPLWRGNYNPDFVSAVSADPGIVSTLSSFALNHKDLLSGPNAQLDSNAGNDLARMAGDNATIEAVAKPLVKAVLDAAPILGPTGALYVHTAYQADAYDAAQCSYYNTCNLPAKLSATVLSHTLTCDYRTIATESLSPADLAAVCASLRGEDVFFHNMVKDNGPVPGQYDKNVTMAVFSNNADYLTYSWAIYGNSTNNGGETPDGRDGPEQPGRVGDVPEVVERRVHRQRVEPQPRVHALHGRHLRHEGQLRHPDLRPGHLVDRKGSPSTSPTPTAAPRHPGDDGGGQAHVQAQHGLPEHVRQLGLDPDLPVGLPRRPVHVREAPGRHHQHARPLPHR
nr:collagenase [Kitasatospora mediocidica]